ncbi:MAG: hypothetical protein JXR19_08165 [Bacteroidia bacterium]
MEREKTKMIEIPDLELEILKLCLYEESFNTICEECQITDDLNIIGDAIKNLIHLKLLKPENTEMRSMSWIYDGDKMNESCFRATAKGVDYMLDH